jgi:hypothetical protein
VVEVFSSVDIMIEENSAESIDGVGNAPDKASPFFKHGTKDLLI